MSTLQQLWERYCCDPEDEIVNEELCERVSKYARIVLKKIDFRDNSRDAYDDLMQSAFACFFRIAPQYKQKGGTLEGYFIYSFRSEILAELKNLGRIIYKQDCDIIDYSFNPLEHMVSHEVQEEIEGLLEEHEVRLLDTYLKEGVTDPKLIAEAEGKDEQEVEWAIDALQNKFRQLLGKEYNFYWRSNDKPRRDCGTS